jgi:hypothetical protein
VRYADEVRALLQSGPMAGRDLRAWLNCTRFWLFRWSGPGFYALMARLEDAGEVRGGWRPHALLLSGDARLRERYYWLPNDGRAT